MKMTEDGFNPCAMYEVKIPTGEKAIAVDVAGSTFVVPGYNITRKPRYYIHYSWPWKGHLPKISILTTPQSADSCTCMYGKPMPKHDEGFSTVFEAGSRAVKDITKAMIDADIFDVRVVDHLSSFYKGFQ